MRIERTGQTLAAAMAEAEFAPHIVMGRVSGGITGTREAPIKQDGAIRYFPSRELAEAEAKRLRDKFNGNPNRCADFHYWAEPA